MTRADGTVPDPVPAGTVDDPPEYPVRPTARVLVWHCPHGCGVSITYGAFTRPPASIDEHLRSHPANL